MIDFLFWIWVYVVFGYITAWYNSKTMLRLCQDDPEFKKGIDEQMEVKGENVYWIFFYLYFIALWWVVLPLVALLAVWDWFRPDNK